jgi:hypothetical protein
MKSKFVKFAEVSFEESLTFGLHPENRTLNPQHLDKIKKQMIKSFDIIPAVTINVRTLHYIDGQHRGMSYTNLYQLGLLPQNAKLKVMFVDIPVEEEKQAIIDANTNSKNWTLENYITSHIKAGLVSYVSLEKWALQHTLTSENGKSKFRYASAIVKGRRCTNEMKNGDFTFTEEELLRAEKVHAEMLEIVELLELKGRGLWIESLAVSWINVREQHDFRVWMKEFKSNKQTILKMPKDNSSDWNNIFAQAHLHIDTKNKK